MNKTININLAGIIFHVDEEAYKKLTAYLQSIKDKLKGDPGMDEIIADIEARIAELFQDKLGKTKEVISMADVESVISVMGAPEDYETEEEETTTSSSHNYGTYSRASSYNFGKKLYRDTDDKVLGGVSSGLGAYFGIDTVWVRLIWVFLFFTWGTGFLLYIILWIVIPEAVTTAQKLQMKGEPINVSNIERSVRNMGTKVENMAKDPKLGNRISNFVDDFLNAVLSILKFIFKIVFKLLGLAFVFLGIVILISLVGALFGHEVIINDNMFGWYNFSDHIDQFLVQAEHRGWIVAGLVMLAAAPVIWLFLLGIKLVFNFKRMSKIPIIASAIVSFAGFIILTYVGVSLGRDFRSKSYAVKIKNIKEVSGLTYYLSVNDLHYLEPNELEEEMGWVLDDDAQFLDKIKLDVRKSDKGDTYLKIVNRAHGRTKGQARERAKNFVYGFEQQDSLLLFDEFFQLPENEKYRNQRLELTIFIPVGTSIYLDYDMETIIYHIENVTETYDDDMLGNTWMMTQNGLVCTDCYDLPKQPSKSKTDNFEEQWEAEAEEMEENRNKSLEELQLENERLKRENKRLEKQKSNTKNSAKKTKFTHNSGFRSPIYILPVSSPTTVLSNMGYVTQV